MKTWKHISGQKTMTGISLEINMVERHPKVRTFFEGNQFIWEASLKP